jgi:transcriptional regulator with XRE-family HTH domain
VITLGDKRSQKDDLAGCRAFVNALRKERTGMKKRIQHDRVSEMVRGLSEDPTYADEFEQRLARRQLVKSLAVLRARAGLSQEELAERLGCTKKKIAGLEASEDADIRFGELVDYVEAVGHEMRILLVPTGQMIAEEVNLHALIIKRLLDRLVSLADGNGALAEGVAIFLEEAASNLARVAKKAAAVLPTASEKLSRAVLVEAPVVEEG